MKTRLSWILMLFVFLNLFSALSLSSSSEDSGSEDCALWWAIFCMKCINGFLTRKMFLVKKFCLCLYKRDPICIKHLFIVSYSRRVRLEQKTGFASGRNHAKPLKKLLTTQLEITQNCNYLNQGLFTLKVAAPETLKKKQLSISLACLFISKRGLKLYFSPYIFLFVW